MNNKEDTYALVVCRGASAQHVVDNITIKEAAKSVIKVSNWLYGKPKLFNNGKFNSIVRKAQHQSLTSTFKWHQLPCKESDRIDLEKYFSIRCFEWKESFSLAWNSGDKGLRSIMLASIEYKKVLVAGFDLWESDYWTDGIFNKDGKYTRDGQVVNKKLPTNINRIEKGTKVKGTVLKALFDFMSKKQDTTFHFYTLSKSLYKRQKEEKLPNVTVELIEKSQ